MSTMKLKRQNANQFKNKGESVWLFPFTCLDPMPGGGNLGRIEWHSEPYRFKKQEGRWYITAILLWATQTRDQRYKGKLFELRCLTEAICGNSVDPLGSLIGCVWHIGRCADHRQLMFSAYPQNDQSLLEVDLNSSLFGTMKLY